MQEPTKIASHENYGSFRGRFFRIRRSNAPVRGGETGTTTKTRKSMSEVRLTAEALDAIRSRPRRGRYVFCRADGGPISPSNLPRDWKDVQRSADS